MRNTLRYDGVVISDDMFMKAVQDYGALDACLMGIRAGLDMFIFRESNLETLKMIEQLVDIVEKNNELKKLVIESNERIMGLKKRYGMV